tara:strand:+ start:544 stop:651 length:108 start_codon:yes stop_codon:yes gene_type:complete
MIEALIGAAAFSIAFSLGFVVGAYYKALKIYGVGE